MPQLIVAPGWSPPTTMGGNSAFALVITRDGSGGTANGTRAVIPGNLSVKLVNGAMTNVSNRSIHTLEECDSSGVCQPAH